MPDTLPHAARRAISAVFFVDGAALGGWVPHITDVKNSLGLDERTLGLALLASAAGAVTTMPLAGPLIHRFGSRNTSLLGGLALCAVLPFLLLAPSLPLFVFMLFLVGISNGQMDVGMNAHSMAVQDRFPRPMISAVHGWFSVGGFAGGAGAALAARFGVHPAVHLAIASALLVVVLIVAVRHLLSADVDKDAEGPRLALPRGTLLLLGILVMFAFVSEGAMWDWAAVYLRESLKSGAALGALGFGLGSLAMAFGRFFGDAWIHRFGPRRVLVLSALLSGGGLLLAVNLGSVPLAIAGFAIAGLGLANLVPVIFRAASQVPGVSAAFGLAAVTTCGYTGFLGGPPIVGLIAHERSLGFALGCSAVLCLVIAAASRVVADEA